MYTWLIHGKNVCKISPVGTCNQGSIEGMVLDDQVLFAIEHFVKIRKNNRFGLWLVSVPEDFPQKVHNEFRLLTFQSRIR